VTLTVVLLVAGLVLLVAGGEDLVPGAAVWGVRLAFSSGAWTCRVRTRQAALACRG
jgi:hypothetical protein